MAWNERISLGCYVVAPKKLSGRYEGLPSNKPTTLIYQRIPTYIHNDLRRRSIHAHFDDVRYQIRHSQVRLWLEELPCLPKGISRGLAPSLRRRYQTQTVAKRLLAHDLQRLRRSSPQSAGDETTGLEKHQTRDRHQVLYCPTSLH